MIQTEDWMLVIVIVSVAVVVTFAVSSFYYTQRVWDLRREHAEEIRAMNSEITQARASVREVRIKGQLLDAIPVSRLIDTEEETNG